MRKLASLFPITLAKLNETQEFVVVRKQMDLQGYLVWEITQAACNLVARYRVDSRGILPADKLGSRLKEYLSRYRETEESPFPPEGYFSKRNLRRQVLADRVARMTRLATPQPGTSFSESEVEPGASAPKNLVYSKQDSIHGWKIIFYDLVTDSNIDDVFLQVLVQDGEIAFEVAESLAHAMATDAGLIWNWLSRSNIKNREPVVISIYEESTFSKLFPEAYKHLLKDGQLTDRVPISIGAARKKNGTLGVRIALKDNLADRDSEKTKNLVLQFALCGVMHLLCQTDQALALDKSGNLVRSL